jgi:hypothetical protein
LSEASPKQDDYMSTGEAGRPHSAARGAAITRQIAQKTGGRIRELEVELSDELIVIRGTVPCYYLKQLVLQAVVDLLGSASAPRIELNVQVLCSVRNPVDRP